MVERPGSLASRPSPDAWIELDDDAIRRNLARVRALAPRARIHVVCKGHAYGFDPVRVAGLAAAAGMDALACGDAADVDRIRAAGVTLPILLYATTRADVLPAIARPGVMVTAHDADSLATCIDSALPFALKLDCGFSRLGFVEADLPRLEQLARQRPRSRPGLFYTHLSDAADLPALTAEVDRFRRMTAGLAAAGWDGVARMVASSRVLIAHPEAVFDAVNPGRAVYGMLEPPYDTRFGGAPALAAVRARVIAVKDVAAGARLGYAAAPLSRATRIAVIPYGFAHGYPRLPAGGEVLVRGRRAPILGPRHTEHTIVDVTDVPGIALGDVVTCLGTDGAEAITAAELAARTGVPLIELVARLAAGGVAALQPISGIVDGSGDTGTSGDSELRR